MPVLAGMAVVQTLEKLMLVLASLTVGVKMAEKLMAGILVVLKIMTGS